MASTVYVVHCVDTEGPLHESVDATFERLESIFGLRLEPSRDMLERLQSGDVDLGGLEGAVQAVVDPHLLSYNDTWDKVDAMLDRIMAPGFRNAVPDSFGNGWLYNWFCVDHVGYAVNPRRRDIGHHNVFDHFRSILRDNDSDQDGVQFHYHPHNFRNEAHRCATHWWASSNSLYEILNRRVIDRRWFPAANRPGFHATRPDSHWFLEQFIPFDFASQAMYQRPNDSAQSGLEGGRFGDWRRAPITWEPFHPSPDDYQLPGNCRRWIARCLNVGTRYRLVTESDVRLAFEEAQAGRPVVLAVTNHDFREMGADVDQVRGLLQRVGADFPDVRFRYSDAIEAMRAALSLPSQDPCSLEVSLEQGSNGGTVLIVESDVPTFGPQPWLALKTQAGTYHHDNFDIDVPFHRWQYVFDEETFALESLESVGIAANNAYGLTTVALFDSETRTVERTYWNGTEVE